MGAGGLRMGTNIQDYYKYTALLFTLPVNEIILRYFSIFRKSMHREQNFYRYT